MSYILSFLHFFSFLLLVHWGCAKEDYIVCYNEYRGGNYIPLKIHV
jgi:hypothetical protein